MKVLVALVLAAYALSAAAQATPQAEAAPPAAEPPPPFDAPSTHALTDEIIKKAVRDTIAAEPHPPPAANQAGVLRVNGAESRMGAAFEQAKVPSCLHDDALKLQPATIGPINVVGPLSLPWIISAALRGKCR